MSVLKGAAVIGQSGGPTSVINASALGCIKTALANENITNVYAAEYGILGILHDRLFDCGKEDPAELDLMKFTPASALGSCRYKLKDPDEDDTDYRRILEIFKKYNIRYFFYNGGNDSMDTCNKVSKYMMKVGYECRIMGIPKTIDNDLIGTDHCPGYASAAKYIATSIAEISRDAHVYETGTIIVFEIMGRNAGWLTAAAALADVCGEGPDLIYLPEITFDMDRFLKEVTEVYEKQKYCIVAVSEGVKDKDGRFISEYGSDLATNTKDVFGHSQMGGLAATLVQYIKNYNGAKTRGIEFSLLQRCAAHCASLTDIEESYASGKAAVECALDGITDKMVGFERPEEGAYECRIKLIDLTAVANAEKTIPRDWINEAGNRMLQPFYDYALPLIQGFPVIPTENGMPRYPRLKKVFANEQ